MEHPDFMPFFKIHEHEGSTYQPGLRRWLLGQPDIKTLVETGSGCSTCFMTMALQERGTGGHLYSIDPAAWCTYQVIHPTVTNVSRKSIDGIVELYSTVRPWDFFLHDGNHDLLAQSYDIWMGFALLRPGGWIWCDDYTWGEHHAWKRFAALHNLPMHDFGACSAIQKPENKEAMDIGMVKEYSNYLKAKFKIEEDKWLASGHTNSSVFAGQ